MAIVFANVAFDQSDLNLNRLYAGAWDYGLFDNSYLTFNGVTYEDSYAVAWTQAGRYFQSVFAGAGQTVNAFSQITGGTVSAYLELGWNGAQYVELWGVQGTSVDAVSLNNAAATPSTVDDYLIFGQILSGADFFYLSNSGDAAFGLGGSDVMYGYSGKDKLSGGEGIDALYGGKGKDRLDGGLDDDFLNGGQGVDRFIFQTGYGIDTIRDFEANGRKHDIIDLSDLDAVRNWRDLRKNHLFKEGSDVVIDAGDGDVLVLEDVRKSELDRGDFVF